MGKKRSEDPYARMAESDMKYRQAYSQQTQPNGQQYNDPRAYCPPQPGAVNQPR